MIQITMSQAISLAYTIFIASIMIFFGLVLVAVSTIVFPGVRALSSQYQSKLFTLLSVTTGSDTSSSSDSSPSSASFEPSPHSPPPQNRSYQVNIHLPVRSTSSTYEWAVVATGLSRIDAEELKHDIDTAFLSCYPEEFAVEVTAQDASTDSTSMATPAQLSIPRAWETKLRVAIEQAEFDRPTDWPQSSPKI